MTRGRHSGGDPSHTERPGQPLGRNVLVARPLGRTRDVGRFVQRRGSEEPARLLFQASCAMLQVDPSASGHLAERMLAQDARAGRDAWVGSIGAGHVPRGLRGGDPDGIHVRRCGSARAMLTLTPRLVFRMGFREPGGTPSACARSLWVQPLASMWSRMSSPGARAVLSSRMAGPPDSLSHPPPSDSGVLHICWTDPQA